MEDFYRISYYTDIKRGIWLPSKIVAVGNSAKLQICEKDVIMHLIRLP